MNSYIEFINPHNIFIFTITILLCFKGWSALLNKNEDDVYSKTILKATKSSKGYQDDTVISSVYKEWWTYVISPIEDNLVKVKIDPNFLTLMSFLVSFLTAYLFSVGSIFFASLVLLAGSSFDILDGRVARINSVSSDKGAFLDSCLDRFSEIVVMFGLLIFYFSTYFVYFIYLAAVFGLTVSYVKAAAENHGFQTNIGIMQRPERVVCLGLGGLISASLEYYGIQLFGIEHLIFMLTIVFITILSLYATIQRLLLGLK
ncbi:CDP-alcohol phosphatidyltransferase family protein [bacterium]|nr:CDP-alcohol phosphatidyltransferase family protein [bacterium]